MPQNGNLEAPGACLCHLGFPRNLALRRLPRANRGLKLKMKASSSAAASFPS